MNIDIREYLRINPISAHELTLSGDMKDCFLLFGEADYQAVTQWDLFRHVYRGIFQQLIEEVDGTFRFRANVSLDSDGNPVVEWDSGAELSESQFARYAKRREMEAFISSTNSSLRSLEVDVKNKIAQLKKGARLDYVGAVELQARCAEVLKNNIYANMLCGEGLIWCHDDGNDAGDGEDLVEIQTPVAHHHPDTRAETMTAPLSAKRGGGSLIDEFYVGSRMVMADDGGFNLPDQSILNPIKGAEVKYDQLTYPLYGQNVLDMRLRRRGHNNIPPITNIWARHRACTSQDAAARSWIQNYSTGQDKMEGIVGQLRKRMFEGCDVEMEHESRTVAELEAYTSKNLTEHDYLLRILKDGDDILLMKQGVQTLLDTFSYDAGARLGVKVDDVFVGISEIMQPLLDEDLALKSDFMKWLAEAGRRIDAILEDLELVQDLLKSVKPLTYVGRIIVSTTDDTERKVIGHYGGKAWRRMVNFLNGVGEDDGSFGGKSGEEYVCLRESNVPIHSHNVRIDRQGGDAPPSWTLKDRGGLETKLVDAAPDQHLKELPGARNAGMEYQISPLEYQKKETPAIPHDNMPPYREVYIWQCTETTDEEKSLLAESVVVTWDTQGGEPLGRSFFEAGSEIGRLPEPRREGYRFRGWWTAPERHPEPEPESSESSLSSLSSLLDSEEKKEEEEAEKIDESYVVERNVTFYARWEMGVYSIAYDLKYCEPDPAWKTTYTIADKDYRPDPDPSASGYEFLDWQPPKILSAWGDMTFTALWGDQTYDIVFDSNGGTSVPSTTRKYGEEIGQLPQTWKEGYDFTGWWIGGLKIGPTYVIRPSDHAAKTITVTAGWNAVEYATTYRMNGHGQIDPNWETTYTIEQINQPPSTNPPPTEEDGFTFAGWTPPTYQKIGGTTFTANWVANGQEITFDHNNGTGQTTVKTISAGQKLGADIPSPAYAGHQIDGWWTDAKAGTKVDANTIVKGPATYYAHWKMQTYAITYNMNGHGAAPYGAKTTYTIDELPYVIPNPAAIQGYEFRRWEPASIPAGTTGDVTVNAIWEADDCTISFVHHDADGTVTTRTMKYDQKMGEMPVPEKPNHAFQGWWSSEQGVGEKASSDTVVKGDAVWHACWEVTSFSITFDPGKGTCSETSRMVKAAEPYGQLPSASRHGFSFRGWWDEDGQRVNESTVPTSDGTLHAHWEGKVYDAASMPYIENTRQYDSAKHDLFDSVQGGGGMKFNLEFSDIVIKHKGDQDDHKVYLKLWAVNKSKTSESKPIGVNAIVVKGGSLVKNGTLVYSGGTKVPTVYIWGLKDTSITVSLKYENITIPYANAKVQLQIYTPDTEDKKNCKGAILYRNGAARLTTLEV